MVTKKSTISFVLMKQSTIKKKGEREVCLFLLPFASAIVLWNVNKSWTWKCLANILQFLPTPSPRYIFPHTSRKKRWKEQCNLSWEFKNNSDKKEGCILGCIPIFCEIENILLFFHFDFSIDFFQKKFSFQEQPVRNSFFPNLRIAQFYICTPVTFFLTQIVGSLRIVVN